MTDSRRQRRIWYAVGGVLVVAFLAYGTTSFKSNLTPYVSFDEAAKTTRNVQVAGRGGVPAGATAVIANLTGTNTTSWGFLSAWPAGSSQPASSNLNFLGGQTVPNLVMLKLGAGGQLSISNGLGSAHVLLDVMGYVN